jgi:hypothetical protein
LSSGPFATYGHQTDIGIATWLKAHGDTIAGRNIEFIRKDDTGLAPDVSKRVTQELAVRDKVWTHRGNPWGVGSGGWSSGAVFEAPAFVSRLDDLAVVCEAVEHHRGAWNALSHAGDVAEKVAEIGG